MKCTHVIERAFDPNSAPEDQQKNQCHLHQSTNQRAYLKEFHKFSLERWYNSGVFPPFFCFFTCICSGIAEGRREKGAVCIACVPVRYVREAAALRQCLYFVRVSKYFCTSKASGGLTWAMNAVLHADELELLRRMYVRHAHALRLLLQGSCVFVCVCVLLCVSA